MSNSESDDLKLFGPLSDVVRRRWWIVILVPLIAAGLVVTLSLQEPPAYASTARVLISDNDLSSIAAGVSTGGGDTDRKIATAAEIARLPAVLQRAELLAGPVSTAAADETTVDVVMVRDTSSGASSNILAFSVTTSEATYAESLSTSLAREFVRFRRNLTTRELHQARRAIGTRIAELRSSGRERDAVVGDLVARYDQLSTLITLGGAEIRQLGPGDTARAVGPNIPRRATASVTIGLVLAILIALGVDRLDRRVRSPEEIQSILGLNVLGRLDDPKKEAARHLPVTISEPENPASEAFRILRTNLLAVANARSAKRIAVTSAVAGEGKTSTCCNLAIVSAAAGLDVILVDLDLRRPRCHSYMRTDRTPGLADLLVGDASLPEVLTDPLDSVSRNRGRLRMMSAGTPVPVGGEVPASPAVARILDELAADCDLLLVDVPPVLVVADALAVGRALDGFVVVSHAEMADRATLSDLRNDLESCPAPVLGLVIAGALRATGRYAYGPEEAKVQPSPASRRAREFPEPATD